MIKKGLLIIYLLTICSLFCSAQTIGTCPVTNYINYFDINCQSYLRAPSEIKLGQARVLMKGTGGIAGRCTSIGGIDISIPQNKPGWAIALAHTHRSMSNLMGGEYLSINHLFATSFQESMLMPNTYGSTWDAAVWPKNVNSANSTCGFSINLSDGYFHTDANGRVFLREIYPTRFPNDAAASPFVSTFEANAHLAMCWINGFYRIRQYGSKLDMQGFFANAVDKYAGTKLTAGAYVSGQGLTDVTTIVGTNRATTIAAADILPYITNGAANTYAYYVSSYTKSLDTPTNIVDPGYESSNHQWYDYQMTWTDVSDYIDKICPFYKEVNCAQAKANVKLVFDAQKAGEPLSFRYEFSKVVDALTANFPYYEPEINSTQFTSYKCNYPCKLSYPVITYNTPLVFCEGLSVNLTTSVGTGYKYDWYKDNVLIVNSDNITYKATTSGVYKVKVTDPQGCSLETNCPVIVKVTKCSSCSMTASAVTTNVKCSGYGDGKIVVTAAGETGPFSYKINGGTIQTSNTFTGLKEGNYFITAYKAADTTCKGFANATISATNIIYNTIKITPTVTACDKVKLDAQVLNNPPSSCNFTFERTSPNLFGDWPADILHVSLVANSSQELYQNTTRKIFTTQVSVPNGAQLSVVIKNISTSSGGSGSDSWTYNIKNPSGTTVGTFTVNPSTSFVKGNTIIIQPFTAACNFTQPNFTYTWSSASSTLSGTSGLTTNATANATGYVKITAANPQTPACPLLDSVLVKNTCAGTCTKPAKPSILSSAGTNVCTGGNTNFSVTLQTGKYYLWYKDNVAIGTATVDVNTLSAQTQAGKYKVRVVDDIAKINDAACYIESDEFTFSINTIPAKPTITGTNKLCIGDHLSLKAASTTTGVTYTWTKPVTSTATANADIISKNGITTTELGKYYVTAAINGCTSATSDTSVVSLNASPTALITTSGSGLSYCANTNGVALTAQTVTSATYEWFKGNVSQGAATNLPTFANAKAGSWTLKVSVGTCSATSSPVTVAESALPGASASASPAIALCLNSQVKLIGASNAPSATFAWDNGVTDNNNFTLDNTNKFKTYTLTVTADGCSAAATLTLTEKTPTAISLNPVGFSACKGADKMLSVTAAGDGVLSYQWLNGTTPAGTDSPALTLNAIKLADAGTYKVRVTGACGTVTSTDAIVVVNDAPAITKQPAKSGGCAGSSAALTVNATGASPLVYQWKKGGIDINGATSSILNFVPLALSDAGVYTVTVSNGCGNVLSDTASIATPANETPDVELAVDQSVVCGGSAVKLTATVRQGGGGLPRFTFKDGMGNVIGTALQTAAFVNTALLTASQVYTVEMTSNSTCLASGAVNPAVSNEIPVTVDIAPKDVSAGTDKNICAGTYTLAGSMPSAGAAGKWSVQAGNGSFTDNTAYNATVSSLDLGVNTYTWTITSGVCAPVSKNVSITRTGSMVPPLAGVDIRTCEGSAVSLSATVLNTGETGKWTIKPATLTVNNSDQASAGISNTVAGTYSVKWTIGNGSCPELADSLELVIDQAPSLPSLAEPTISTCATQVNLNAHTPAVGHGFWSITSGSGSIALADSSNPAALLTGLSASTTLAWVVKNGVCAPAGPAQLTVAQAGSLTAPKISLEGNEITTPAIDICKNKAYTFVANAVTTAETGTWSSTGSSIMPLGGSALSQPLVINGTGTATITWTVSSSVPGCNPAPKTITLNISDVLPAPASIDGIVPVPACQGAVITQSTPDITGATGYVWELDNATGTSVTSSIQLTLGTAPLTKVSVLAVNGCGNSLPLSKDITVSPNLIPSISDVDVAGNNGCAGAEFTISAQADNAGASPVFTFGRKAQTGQGSYTYKPTASEKVLIILTRDSSVPGCFTKDTASAIVAVNVKTAFLPTIKISPENPQICKGATFTFAAAASSGSIQWYVGGSPVSGETNVTFSHAGFNNNDLVKAVLVSDQACATTPSVEDFTAVKVNEIVNAQVSMEGDMQVCDGANALFTAIPVLGGNNPQYQWLVNGQPAGPFSASAAFQTTALEDGDIVTVQMNPDHVCKPLVPVESAQMTVAVIAAPFADAGQDMELEKVQPVRLNGSANPGYTYQWTADNPLALIQPDTALITTVSSNAVKTIYTLTVSKPGSGCQNSTDEVLVYFNIRVKIPTSFSPNQDNNHDLMEIPNIYLYPKASVTIFNQWGQMVYKSPVPYQPWDGKHDGKDVAESTYYYIIEFNDNNITNIAGYVTLIR